MRSLFRGEAGMGNLCTVLPLYRNLHSCGAACNSVTSTDPLLEREAESRIRLGMFVENLVPNFVEGDRQKDQYVDTFLCHHYLCYLFHLWLVLLFLYLAPAEWNLAELDNFENFSGSFGLHVETWIWPSLGPIVRFPSRLCLEWSRIGCWQLIGA